MPTGPRPLRTGRRGTSRSGPGAGRNGGCWAGRCGIPERSARAMADLLADAGLLVRNGTAFRTAPDAEAFLTGRGPVDLRPMARYWSTVSYPAWDNATEAFRTRRGVRPVLDRAQTEAYESTVALVTAGTAADLVRAYDFGRHRRLLDVGGGYGSSPGPSWPRTSS